MTQNQTFENCTLLDTKTWFEKARPNPTERDLTTQIGVHLEEVEEFVASLEGTTARAQSLLQEVSNILEEIADYIKATPGSVVVADDVEALDALCDGIVTGTGVAHCLGYDIIGAMTEVNRSNFSKFDDEGKPIYDANKKVIKGPKYFKPDLAPYLPKHD